MTVGLEAITTADVAQFIGLAWAVLPAAFFSGWLYLRMRTLPETVF